MTALDSTFVSRARQSDVNVNIGDRSYRFSRTDARSGMVVADLAVYDGQLLVAYVTPYSDSEHGFVQARRLGVGLPTVYRTVEEAVEGEL